VLDSALVVSVVGSALVLSGIALHQGLEQYLRAALLLAALAALGGLGFLIVKYRRSTAALFAQRKELQETRERLNWALWGTGDGLWLWDMQAGTIQSVASGEVYGERAPIHFDERDWRERNIHPEDRTRVEAALREQIEGLSEAFDCEYRALDGSGAWVWLRARGRIVGRDEDGRPLRMAGTYRLVSAEREMEEQRRISVEIIALMSEAVTVTTMDFRFVQINPAFSRITGYAASEVVGRDASLLDSPRLSTERYREVRAQLLQHGEWRGELWQRQKNGRDFLAAIEIRQVIDDRGEPVRLLAVLEDITERKRAEQTLRYLASYDILTGLPNRSLLVSRLQQAIARASQAQSRLALLFIDLDRFKHVNDSLGHAVGDELLRQVARRISATVGDKERTARLGGDEFTVLLPEVRGDQLKQLADDLIDAFAAPIVLQQSEISISPSIGIALYPDHAQTVEELLKCADSAMYQAKRRGRNIAQLYSPELASSSHQRTRIESALRRALDRDELRLVYQPKVELRSGRIVGVEALLRWRSEDLGDIGPVEFIPIAEETGLILPIGEWVLRQGLEQLARWHALPGLAHLHMAINVSAAQIHRGDFNSMVQTLLRGQGVPPERLELEITESVLMNDPLQGSLVGGDLRRSGVRICIDDFGTGYSSLSYLQRLSIDRLKIDQSFIHAIDGLGDGGVLASTMILMAHSLGLSVVAEGVSSAEQWHYLQNENCDEIQGYLISEPLETEACLAFLREHADGWRLSQG
jgi:diguanylate cyclase (GGDEF)-like protein/PAS domain S-box-containing protein